MQAARWTSLKDGLGYIYSFNGSHSLFIDTIRTLRICCIAHMLGHTLQGEQDQRINLLDRALTHAKTSARFNIYYGEGRDHYDRRRCAGEPCTKPSSIRRAASSAALYAAGLLAVHYLDPRPGLGHARLSRADGVPPDRPGWTCRQAGDHWL